jgi:hypothetical protein
MPPMEGGGSAKSRRTESSSTLIYSLIFQSQTRSMKISPYGDYSMQVEERVN